MTITAEEAWEYLSEVEGRDDLPTAQDADRWLDNAIHLASERLHGERGWDEWAWCSAIAEHVDDLLKRLADAIEAANDEGEDDTCASCDGSCEGRFPGHNCGTCRGLGVKRRARDDDDRSADERWGDDR